MRGERSARITVERLASLSRLLLLLLLLSAVLTVRIVAQRAGGAETALDWRQFGYDVASSSASPARTGINIANVTSLTHRQASLGGTADASAIYLHSVKIAGSFHDTFFVTTSNGTTMAIDANTGAALWQFTLTSYSSLVGTAQITNSTPAADPNREFIYAAAPDGTVQNLAVADGHVVWSTSITLPIALATYPANRARSGRDQRMLICKWEPR